MLGNGIKEDIINYLIMNYKLSKNNSLSWPLMLLIAGLLLNSCGNIKATNCRKIIDISAKIARETKENLKTQNIERILNVAKTFENTARDIKNIKITDEQLKTYSQDLADIYQHYAKITSNFVKAFQQKDREQAIFYKNQVNKLFQQQQQLVSNINNYCQP